MSPLRTEGRIRGNKGCAIPANCLFFDIETYTPDPKPEWVELPFRLGCCIYYLLDSEGNIKRKVEHRLHRETDILDVINHYSRSNTKLYLFAHNAAFDVLATRLLTQLIKAKWTVKPPVWDSGLFICYAKQGTSSLVVLDTMNYFKTSVAVLGSILGYEKLEVDFNTATDEELYIYCRRDTEIIAHTMINYLKMIKGEDLGNFAYTIAGQALNAWRHRLRDCDVRLTMDEDVIALERNAYFGGRVECFHMGPLSPKKIHCLDINSMYPWAMRDNPLPIKHMKTFSDLPLEFLDRLITNWYVIADVTVDVSRPVAPYYKDGDLLYPIGVFRTTLHKPELLNVLRHGRVRQIHKIACYRQGQPFTAYVDYFMGQKLKAEAEGNQVFRQFYKLFLNSLYGKFGQLKVNELVVGETDSETISRNIVYNLDTGLSYEEIAIGGSLYRRWRQGECFHSTPSLAGAITAYARARLWELIEKADPEHVYYCDTDSLFVDDVGLSNLSDYMDDHKLGYLKHEWEDDNVTILGLKHYVTSRKRVIRGIPRNAEEVAPNKFRFLTFSTFTWAMNKGLETYPATKIEHRYVSKPYTKGRVMPNGRVKPLLFGNVALDEQG